MESRLKLCCVECDDSAGLSDAEIYLIVFCAILGVLVLLTILFVVVWKRRRSGNSGGGVERRRQSGGDSFDLEESTSHGFRQKRLEEWIQDAEQRVYDPIASTWSRGRRSGRGCDEDSVSVSTQRDDVTCTEADIDDDVNIEVEMEKRRPGLPEEWVKYVPGEGLTPTNRNKNSENRRSGSETKISKSTKSFSVRSSSI